VQYNITCKFHTIANNKHGSCTVCTSEHNDANANAHWCTLLVCLWSSHALCLSCITTFTIITTSPLLPLHRLNLNVWAIDKVLKCTATTVSYSRNQCTTFENCFKTESKLLDTITVISCKYLQYINTWKYQFSATLNNMKLVHWPLTGELLYLVQRGNWAGPQPIQAPPHCTKCTYQRPVYQSPYCCIAVHCPAVLMCLLNGYTSSKCSCTCINYTMLGRHTTCC